LNYSSQTITGPSYELQTSSGRYFRQPRTIEIPGQTITEPTNVPDGMGPLTLPSDFNHTINDQFCFLLQNNGLDNYSLNMKALDDYDMANLTQENQSNTALLNVSGNVKEDAWYTITEDESGNQITAYINDANGTFLGSMTTPQSAIAILVANDVDNAVIFKNLQIHAPLVPKGSPEPAANTPNLSGLLTPYFVLVVIFVVSVLAAVFTLVKKKSSKKLVPTRNFKSFLKTKIRNSRKPANYKAAGKSTFNALQ
jgi:hypothetical protein